MKKWKWDLQLFADGDGADVNGAEQTEGQTEQNEKPESTSDFDSILKDPKLKAEFDRRVTKAMQTREASLAEKHKSEIEAAKAEAGKLASMDAEQKRQYEIEQLQKENEALKAAAQRVELTKAATAALRAEKIEATEAMIDLVVGADEEATKANIDKLVGIIRAQIKAAEVERATGAAPKKYEGAKKEMSEFEKRIAKYR